MHGLIWIGSGWGGLFDGVAARGPMLVGPLTAWDFCGGTNKSIAAARNG